MNISGFDLNGFIQQLVILAPPFLFALTIHELAHGLVALQLGDPTAKQQGRLSLNPLKHLDPIGVIAFFLVKIGWAKPVPVDPRYFKNPRKDMLLVALAGPAANVGLAVLSSVLLKLLLFMHFLPIAILRPLVEMLANSVWINIMLAIFNCFPVPPLDGSKILMSFLSHRAALTYSRLEPYGFILLLVLFYTGIIGRIIMPIINGTSHLLLR